MPKSDYLDPRWQKFRLERLKIADWKCEACGASDETLHVHHAFYISRRKPWEYLPESLVVLCDGCHDMFHYFQGDFAEYGGDTWEYAAARAIRDKTRRMFEKFGTVK